MNRHTKDINRLYSQLKESAKKRNIEFSLLLSDLNDLTFPITCPILNIPMTFNTGRALDNSYSVDRIDSSKGYIEGNIVVISNRANRLKSDATLDELKNLVEFYSNPF